MRGLASGRDHRLGWVDGDDLVEAVRQSDRNLAGTTADVERAAASWLQRQQPIEHRRRIGRARVVGASHIFLVERRSAASSAVHLRPLSLTPKHRRLS
jgi:multidrug resistance efflux pump